MAIRNGVELRYMWKKCVICGKLFEPNTGSQIYCSHECYLEGSRARRNYTKQIKKQRAKNLANVDDRHEERLNWGIDYGRRQMAETLAMVGKVEL